MRHCVMSRGYRFNCFNRRDLNNSRPLSSGDGCSGEPSKQSSPLLCSPPQASWQSVQGMGPASAAEMQRLSRSTWLSTSEGTKLRQWVVTWAVKPRVHAMLCLKLRPFMEAVSCCMMGPNSASGRTY